MTRESYWDGLCSVNVALAKGSGPVRLDVAKLRDIVFQAFDTGAASVPASKVESDGVKRFKDIFGLHGK